MKRGPLVIRLGMIAYDVLSFDKSMANHRMLSREETLEREPGLNSEGLRAAAFYHDAQVEYAERLAVENAVSAHEHGALVLTLCEGGTPARRERADRRAVCGCARRRHVRRSCARDGQCRRSVGRRGAGGHGLPGESHDGRYQGQPHHSGPLSWRTEGETLYVEARKDGRPYFINPWNGRYLIGTTDIRHEETSTESSLTTRR